MCRGGKVNNDGRPYLESVLTGALNFMYGRQLALLDYGGILCFRSPGTGQRPFH